MDRNAPIGVFDSGIGGLTVAREIMAQLPGERLIYFGDTARVPYGNRTKETIIRFSAQIVRFLKSQGVKAVIIACNTATACALEAVSRGLDIPIIGVVEPGARVACETTVNDRIGVIGTEATVHSGIYTSFIRRQKPDVQVVSKACPLFVPLVEEGWLKDPITMEVARRYLEELLQYDIDTLILGCTHYPLLRKAIGRLVGDGVTLVNPAYETACSLRELLKEEGIYRESGEPSYSFFVSDGAERFSNFANSILPVDLVPTRLVPIENY